MEPSKIDVAGQENAAPLSATAFGWWRKDVPQEVCYRYWRDVHGVLAARIPGLYQYRQLHLSLNRSDLWPTLDGINYVLPASDQPNGIAQLLFLSDEDAQTFGTHPFITKHVFEDEQNLAARNVTYRSLAGNSRTFIDRTGHGEPQGEPTFPAFVLCFKQANGISVEEFRRHMVERVARPWSELNSVMRLRLQLLEPYDEFGWQSPGVAHDWPTEKQYQAWIELMLRDETSAPQLFADTKQSEYARYIKAIHTFPIHARYTLVFDNKPTDVGLRGFPAVQTIEQTGADNQKAIELLEAMYGGVVHGAKV